MAFTIGGDASGTCRACLRHGVSKPIARLLQLPGSAISPEFCWLRYNIRDSDDASREGAHTKHKIVKCFNAAVSRECQGDTLDAALAVVSPYR